MSKRIGKINKEFRWDELLGIFLAEKKAQGRSVTTIKDYDYHIRQFYKRYPEGDTKTNIYSYMSEDIAPATYNLRLAYLRAFYNWCIENEYLYINPIKSLKKRYAEARIVSIDPQVLSILLQLPNISTYAGLRDKYLLTLTLDCGIRPKEGLSLLISDYKAKALEIVVRAQNAKTRVQRILPISQVTSSLISRLIAVRTPQWGKDIPLFASSDGTQLTRRGWEDRLELYSGMLGVKILPYDLSYPNLNKIQTFFKNA